LSKYKKAIATRHSPDTRYKTDDNFAVPKSVNDAWLFGLRQASQWNSAETSTVTANVIARLRSAGLDIAQKLGGVLAETMITSSLPTLRKRCGVRLSK
jgi:hypothetical protein